VDVMVGAHRQSSSSRSSDLQGAHTFLAYTYVIIMPALYCVISVLLRVVFVFGGKVFYFEERFVVELETATQHVSNMYVSNLLPSGRVLCETPYQQNNLF